MPVIRKYRDTDVEQVLSAWENTQELHGDLVVEVFEKNTVGRKFYSQYGFTLVEKKVHEQTGESLLRLEFIANKALESSD